MPPKKPPMPVASASSKSASKTNKSAPIKSRTASAEAAPSQDTRQYLSTQSRTEAPIPSEQTVSGNVRAGASSQVDASLSGHAPARVSGNVASSNGAGKRGQFSPEQRHHMIAEAAYYKSCQRNFVGGDPQADWFAAEAEVDNLLTAHHP